MRSNADGRRTLAPGTADTRCPTEIAVAVGAAVTVAAASLAASIPVVHTAWRLAVVAAAVGLFAAATRRSLAVAGVAALAWTVVDGFLVNRFGELSWHGSADLYRVITLVLAGGLGLAVGRVCERVSEFRGRRRLEAEWSRLVHDFEEERLDA